MKNVILFFLLLFAISANCQLISVTDASTNLTAIINANDIRYAYRDGSVTLIVKGDNLTRIKATEALSNIVTQSNGALYEFTNDKNGASYAVGKAFIRQIMPTSDNKAVVIVNGVAGGFVTRDAFTYVQKDALNKTVINSEFSELQMVVANPDTLTADTLAFGTNSRVEDWVRAISNGNWTTSLANGTITYTGVDSILVEVSYRFSLTHSAATSAVTGVVYAGSTAIEASRIVQGTATGVREIVGNTCKVWLQPNTAISTKLSAAAGTIIAYTGTFSINRL